MTKNNFLSITFLLLCAAHSFSQTNLSGDISGMILNKMGSPYIVTKDIFISGDEEVVIKAGTVLLFHSFTGLTVFGNLFVEGTKDQQVIFSSINDSVYNTNAETSPEAFDWNGISVERNADNVKLRNFCLSFSVFGIKSQKKDVIIVNGVFKNNGQFNFTIDNKIMMVDDKLSYSYNADKKDRAKPKIIATTDTVVIKTGKERRAFTPRQKKLRTVTFISLGTGVATGVGSAICFVASKKNKDLHARATIPAEINKYEENYYRYRNAGIGTAVGGGVLVATAAVFYFISLNDQSKKKKSTTTIKITLDIPKGYLASGCDNYSAKDAWGVKVTGDF